ncbi:unnamed protein product [Cuscuta epithymum]|uniref:Retrovirus-related Pol polyprotein from transposon TNT 1-94-like beta-barrel domain-containing protein n=1 Tax=Cuscuta epithymum TaxID=186058 RepID=A0AAV0E010_9ASTE|nr:unnamed protein product [Cuscuta epithymum]
MGLDGETYGGLRSNILSMDDLPSLSRVYNVLLQEERHQKVTRNQDAREVDAFAMRPRGQWNRDAREVTAAATRSGGHLGFQDRKDKAKLICPYCKKEGHERERCFKLKGSTLNGGMRAKLGEAKNVHEARERRLTAVLEHKQMQWLDMVWAQLKKWWTLRIFLRISLLSWEISEISLWNFWKKKYNTCEGVDKLAGMLDMTHLNWFFDIGVSYHMTGDKNIMIDISSVSPIPVTLHNGNVMFASHVGRVEIAMGVTLERVLLVPNLTCHLISIGRLIDDLPCRVIFTNKFCVIQDLSLKTLIGVGERGGGIYYLCRVEPVRVSHVKMESKEQLWYRRMGHPSQRVIRLLYVSENKLKIMLV